MLSFKGRHFPKAIILMAVRWYVAYALSYRDIEELMNERGVKVDHATVQRWLVEYSPELMEQARKVMKSSADSWRIGCHGAHSQFVGRLVKGSSTQPRHQ